MGKRLSQEDIIRALLDTAFFKSAGATSLADIADKLGIKKASLYNHFTSRDDLLEKTFAYCGDFVRPITFMPPEIDSVTKKYPAEAVIKGIINRYFKMHEKYPLFQVYTFVESQKYFSKAATDIVRQEDEKLVNQTLTVLNSMLENGKIRLSQEALKPAAVWFCRGVHDLLNLYLLERKQIVVKNPASGEGELFTLPSDSSALEKVDALADSFVAFIKGGAA